MKIPKGKREFKWFWGWVIGGFLLVFLDWRGWLRPVRQLIEKPILVMEEKIFLCRWPLEQVSLYFSSKKKMKEEIEKLEAQVRNLAVDQNKLAECLEENKHIRRLLGAPLPSSWKFLPARVVGRKEGIIRIDKGEKSGVKMGMSVVSENILIGRIKAVEEGMSIVYLPTNEEEKIPVLVRRVGKEGFQAQGMLVSVGGQLVLERVLQTEDIQTGDLVVSKGEEWLPYLLIGKIEEVLSKPAEVYQKAKVKPLVEYDNLRIVFVVISN